NLTPNEYKILALLATNREQIFSRHKIVESVWGADTHISDKAVNSHISNLRKKIQDSVCKISSEDKGYFLKIS
ncbi:MAG: DNA-binding response regulator, partial [Pseudobdellovibrio sp.]|nr:DNA-binding response regulator [Pseudobdellovibrio sp.]